MKEIINKGNLNEHSKTAFGGLLGFLFFFLATHPKSPVNRKIPEKKIKNVSYLPHIKIEHKDKSLHLHHWTIFSVLSLPLFLIKKDPFKSKIVRGFFLGSIIQGLTYKDRFSILKRKPAEK